MRAVKDFFRVIYRNKKSFAGLLILIFFILMAVFGPFIMKYDMTVKFTERFQGASFQHLLGTDYGGRDELMQVVYGSRDVLSVGLLAGVITLVIGFIVGAVAGFAGSFIDTLLMFITNLFLTIPSFPIMMICAALFNIKSTVAFAGMLSLFSWAGLARSVRSQILSLKQRDFIVVCRIMGLKTSYIIGKEMLPNLTSYIAITFIFTMQGAINASLGLMMIGLAAYSPTHWGAMLNLAILNTGGIFNPKGYLSLFTPIVCLGLLQMGCIFFASGIDEALNPRLRTQ